MIYQFDFNERFSSYKIPNNRLFPKLFLLVKNVVNSRLSNIP